MKIYNTLSNKKEEFVPVENGKVRMYVCGPTVYNYFHIGNARPLIFFDVVKNFFKYLGNDVTLV
ncbi:MAG: cysteine--tRNA ligase, partial [Candidatus Cloacimonetes bacterium]|nr:cysteine--tRNA ligase [Candidatus Cloacimonadota bacterium]